MLWKQKIFCEKLPVTVDVNQLREYFLANIIDTLPAVWQGTYDPIKEVYLTTAMLSDENIPKFWGGWSLQSFDGEYTSAWEPGHWRIPQNNFKVKVRLKRPDIEQTMPTQICKGPFFELIDQMSKLGFCPHRARIVCVPKQTALAWHVDTSTPEVYTARVHVPLITNEKCYFESETERFKMAADGSVYILNNNLMHRFVNDSDSHRFHVIFNAFDTKCMSQNLHYPQKPATSA